jgi:hypothetical protein
MPVDVLTGYLEVLWSYRCRRVHLDETDQKQSTHALSGKHTLESGQEAFGWMILISQVTVITPHCVRYGVTFKAAGVPDELSHPDSKGVLLEW